MIDFLITNLNTAGKLKINQKLSIRHGHLQVGNFSILSRWYNKDSRELIITFFRDLIKKIKELGDLEPYEKELMKNAINQAEAGLSNLKITYKNDAYITVCIDNIVNRLQEINEKY
jgi:hypothetical protein